VLRLAPGDTLEVTDGEGSIARCTVESLASEVVVSVHEVERHDRPTPHVVVYQGAGKGRKLDDVVARLAEVGVAEARAFSSRRAVARWSDPKQAALGARWQAIARSVAKQSRQPWLMATGTPLDWPGLVDAVRREPSPIVLWEEATERLRSFLGAGDRIALVVGPEGGLDRQEAYELAAAGARLASLGPFLLRTENAAFVAASAILWHFGLIG
jgi:16S rRNA (uracil1498-N3)-methyltransferase